MWTWKVSELPNQARRLEKAPSHSDINIKTKYRSGSRGYRTSLLWKVRMYYPRHQPEMRSRQSTGRRTWMKRSWTWRDREQARTRSQRIARGSLLRVRRKTRGRLCAIMDLNMRRLISIRLMCNKQRVETTKIRPGLRKVKGQAAGDKARCLTFS